MLIFKELQINDQIICKEVRLLGAEGEQLGIMSLDDAKNLANQQSLDIVMMSPNANPPVCKIMDYGKFKFDSIKKEKEQKKAQKVCELKEIQLSLTIDKHDLDVKAKHGLRFLKDGNKIKVVLRMKGRQQAYAKNATVVVKNFYLMLEEFGTYDKEPQIMGRNVIMIISPKK